MTFVVAGATGTVGREVVEQLVQQGQHVRALTRNPAKANLPAGVEVVAADLAKPETLEPALEGATGLHLINFGGDGYTPLETGPEIVKLAAAAGVRRLSLLMGGQRGGVEDAVEGSELAWTMLQPVEFMSNYLEWAEPIRAEGVVREGFGGRRSAMVHEADIASVAVTALTSDGHGGKTYTLTGPEVLTPVDVAREIGVATGRDVRFEELTVEQAKERWRAEGHSEETIGFFLWVYGNTPEIGYTVVPTVEEVTGRPARTFAQWAAEHADTFRP